MPEMPASVTRAIWLLRVVVVWAGLTALLTWVFSDQLIRAWAAGNETARVILDERGLEGLKESSINIPAFAPVAIVLFVVFAAMAGVLVVFFRAGHGWARMAMTLMVVFMGFSTVAGLRRDPPGFFIALSVIGLLLSLSLLVLLWHRDTSRYLKAPYVRSA
ncbi:MAG: hypothetical protein U0R80_11920 [Nocardioidaceae bacterium]